LKPNESRNNLYDLVRHKHIAIHIERASSRNPFDIVNKTLIFDDNFMNNEKTREFAKKGKSEN